MNMKSFLSGILMGGLAGVLAFAMTAKATALNPGDLLNSPPTVFDTLSGSPGSLVSASTGTITTSSFTADIRRLPSIATSPVRPWDGILRKERLPR